MTLYLPDFMPDLKYWSSTTRSWPSPRGACTSGATEDGLPIHPLYRVGELLTTRKSGHDGAHQLRDSWRLDNPCKGHRPTTPRGICRQHGVELWAFEPGRSSLSDNPPGMTYCLGIQVLSNIDLPTPDRDPRFILDAHFYMRMAGDADLELLPARRARGPVPLQLP